MIKLEIPIAYIIIKKLLKEGKPERNKTSFLFPEGNILHLIAELSKFLR